MINSFKLIFLLGLAFLFACSCSNVKPNYNIDKLVDINDYPVANYAIDLENKYANIAYMRIFYPFAKAQSGAKFVNAEENKNLPKCALTDAPVVIAFHGYISYAKKLYWLGELLARKGYIVAIPTMSYTFNPFQTPKKWIGGFEHAIVAIKYEGQKKFSPLYNKLNFDNLNLIGHSMGGGGLMHFLDAKKTKVKNWKIASAIALAPFSLKYNKPGSNAKMPVFILCGLEDYIAPCRMAKNFYDVLPTDTTKTYMSLRKVRHTDFERHVKYHNEIGSYILAWLDFFAQQKAKSKLFDTSTQDDNVSTKLVENF